jgi:hypothetical protein
VVILAASSALFAFGPARLRFWNCRDVAERPTIRAAVDTYYASCWDHPDRYERPYDGRPDGVEYQAWHEFKELVALFDHGAPRFVIVGRRTSGSGWVVVSVGSGP